MEGLGVSVTLGRCSRAWTPSGLIAWKREPGVGSVEELQNSWMFRAGRADVVVLAGVSGLG